MTLGASHDKVHDNQCHIPLNSSLCRILPRSPQECSSQQIKKCLHQDDPKCSSSKVTTSVNLKGRVGEKHLHVAFLFHHSAMGKSGSCCSICSHVASPTCPSTLAQSWQLLRAQILQHKFSFKKHWKKTPNILHLTFKRGVLFTVQLSDVTAPPRDRKADNQQQFYSCAIYSLASLTQGTQKCSGIKDFHCTGPTYRDKEIKYGQEIGRQEAQVWRNSCIC